MKNRFMATTAIEEFWNTSTRVVFLGEWCRLYGRKSFWSELDSEIAPFVFNDGESINSAIEHCAQVYEEVLPKVADTLNEYHGQSKSVMYYRVLLGNWLMMFIQQFYEKCITLETALDKYPDASTYLLDESQYYIPATSLESVSMIASDDRYALQQYSQILSCMGKDFERKKLTDPILIKDEIHLSGAKIERIKKVVKKARDMVENKKESILFSQVYLKDRKDIEFLKSAVKGIRLIFDNFQYDVRMPVRIDWIFRKRAIAGSNNEFGGKLYKNILLNLPLIYVEGYSQFVNKVKSLHLPEPDVVFTSNALQYNEVFKLFCAEHFGDNKILSMQHGSGYGINLLNNAEEYEKSISNTFYTAGWTKDDNKTKPLSPAFLVSAKSGISKNKSEFDTGKTLLILNEMPRYYYFLECHYFSSNYPRVCIGGVVKFLEKYLHRNSLLVRSHPVGIYKWDTYDRLTSLFNEIATDDMSVDFFQRVSEARVCVTNHIGTSFLELMSVKKPTVIFLDRDLFRPHHEAIPYLAKLAAAGILHYSPESAAKHLNEVYDNIQDWWSREDVVDAVDSFCDKYARCNDNWAEEWADEFGRVMKE